MRTNTKRIKQKTKRWKRTRTRTKPKETIQQNKHQNKLLYYSTKENLYNDVRILVDSKMSKPLAIES